MSTIGHKVRGHGGFTFVEILITTSIGVTMIGIAVLSSVGLMKNIASATAYRNVHENARQAIAFINRDIRASSNLTSFASNDITLGVVDQSAAAATCRYQLVSGSLIRVYTVGGTTTTNTLTDNVTQVTFERWNNPGTTASNNTDTYEIRVSLTVTNASSVAMYNARDTLQTRVLMRNKP